MTTTNDNGTALAVSKLSEQQIRTRMTLNAQARFGLQDATPAQLNVVFLLAQRWGLDPVTELTLYEGRPFITLDGRLQLARRNPDYRGYRTRALSRTEREDWGYEPDDIVVECTVLTHAHGEITERGCVRRVEIEAARKRAAESNKRSAPVGIYGPEIAEGRAIKRSTRAAFGQDIPDEEDVTTWQIQQQNPVRQAALAAEHTRIFGSDDDGTAYADMPLSKAIKRPQDDDQLMTARAEAESVADPRQERLDTLKQMAKKRGIKAGPPLVPTGVDALDFAIDWYDRSCADHDSAQEVEAEQAALQV